MDEFLKLLLADVEKVAGELSKVAPHVWRVYVRQVYVDGVTNLIWALLSSVMIVLSVKWIAKLIGRIAEDKWDEDELLYVMGVFGSASVLCIAVIVLAICLSGGIGRFINPEYYAIKALFTTVGGGSGG